MRALLAAAAALLLRIPGAAPFAAPAVRTSTLSLGTGIDMETLRCGDAGGAAPTAVLVHGSYHGAWCWGEKWMPYLAERGVPSVALNLRGTSGAPVPPDYNDGNKKVPLADHMADLTSALGQLADEAGDAGLLLVGHSFGGLIAMKFMEEAFGKALVDQGRLRGLGLLASVPACGNGPQTKRMLFSTPILAMKMTWGFVSKAICREVDLCRLCLMDAAMPDEEIERYMEQLQKDCEYGLVIPEVNANLPEKTAMDSSGRATWLRSEENPNGLDRENVLVVGAADDVLVDATSVQNLADFIGVEQVTLPATAHDLMLDSRGWRSAADAVLDWASRVRDAAPRRAA